MLLCAVFSLYAQNELPVFNDFPLAEQNYKTSDLDKDADAIIFFDVASANYNDEHNLVTNRRVRFKILREKGIQKANIEIPYYSKNNFENISNLKAISYTLDDNGNTVVKEIDNSATFKQKINERVSVVKFTLPNVKIGSIIEYQYTSTMDNYGGLQDWYFQTDMPTMLSRYSITIIPNAEFIYFIHKANNLPIKIKDDKSNGSVNFEMNNIAGLHYEPYAASPRDYFQRVEFQLSGYRSVYGSNIKFMNTWKQAAEELFGSYYYGRQFDKSLPHSDDIILKANVFSTQYNKMNFIYEYVKNNFIWNGINSKFANDGIKNVWENRRGTSGEINIVLINLLKSAGLETYPLLVSEREHGKVTPQYPILDQFNKVDAYVIIDKNKYVLDATEINTPANIIPFNILNTYAFKVDTKTPDIIQLQGEVKTNSNYINLYSTLNSNAIMNGEAVINSSDYAKIPRITSLKKSKENFKNDYFEKLYPDIRIDSFELNHADIDSLSFEQSFKFSMPVNTSGNYKMINYNLFTGLEKNPFISDNRFTNVDYGCKYITSAHEIFVIPETLKPDELPKNIQLIMPDKSIIFVRQISIENKNITVDLVFKINKTIFTPDEYPYLKEYYKKMSDLLNEQIVLTEK